MKKIFLFAFLSSLFILVFSASAFAKESVSVAIDVIAEQNSMAKSATVYAGEIKFNENDFDTNIGAKVKSVTIVSLPDESAGRLMLGKLYVVENQVISRDELSSLKFVASSSDEITSVFDFEPYESGYSVECSLIMTKETNFSPVAKDGGVISTWTKENISSYGTLDGYDPDGDDLRFEFVSLPKKGLIEFTNKSTGDYKYTPYENAYGTDTFSYRVRDSHGNFSDICEVNMKVERLRTSLVFSDMTDNKAYNAALIVSENNLMTSVKCDDGSFLFNPEKEITREEFVFLVMKAMGAENVPETSVTRFADDKNISKEYKGYVECAYSLGIIEGEKKVDGVYINPKEPITTATASVIINRIIGAKTENAKTTFADADNIPDWAKESMVSLNELGIIPKSDGKINPNSPLTRAQTAQILMSLLEYRGKINHR